MNFLLDCILLFGVAFIGLGVFLRLGLAVPAFLGPLVFTGGLNYFYLYPEIDLSTLSFLAKVAIGVMLGRRFTRNSIHAIKKLFIPSIITACWVILGSLCSGYILYLCTDLSLIAALIGSASGGLAEMIIFGLSLNEDVVPIVFIQSFRLIIVVFCIPYILRAWTYIANKKGIVYSKDTSELNELAKLKNFNLPWYFAIIIFSTLGGYLFEAFRLPAGAMLGSFLVSTVTVMLSGRNCLFSPKITIIAQLSLSVVIAKSMTHDTFSVLADLFFPLLLPTLFLMLFSFSLCYFLYRFMKWNPITCILATVPAGLIQVISISEDLGADVMKVGVLHLVRVVAIVLSYPIIIRLFV